MRAVGWIAVWVVSLASATGTAQTVMVGGVVGGIGSAGSAVGGAPVQPYTATRKTTTVQKLFDGTTITRVTTAKEARDSQGRTFHQQTTNMETSGSQRPPVFFCTVVDPVERVTLSWSTQGKVVTRFHMPEPLTQAQIQARAQAQPRPPVVQGSVIAGTTAGAVSGGVASGAGQAALEQIPGLRTLPDARLVPKMRREQLDGKTIAGVYARGTRFTTTYPVGSIGNDRPIAVVQETWTSPDLRIVVLSINDDPRTGLRTTELTDLDRDEPDPALFKAPEGYTIQEQRQNTQ
jgi:hypothetical protein